MSAAVHTCNRLAVPCACPCACVVALAWLPVHGGWLCLRCGHRAWTPAELLLLATWDGGRRGA